MKRIQSLVHGLVACGVALALLSTAAAQTAVQGTARVFKIKGNARYTTGNNVWQPLKVGATLRPGAVIQTGIERGSYVDLILLDAESAALPGGGGGASSPEVMLYQQQSSEQNIVRVWENSLLGIDKLSTMETGADTVTETQLDLRAGRIFGNVKKMSAASKYEVKIPNGVAGIRGTTYEISADGVVRVLVGSLVIAYIGPDGTAITQVVMGGQQFDARTGQITPIANFDQKEMVKTAKAARIGPNTPPTAFTVDHTIYYVSPVIGKNGNEGTSGGASGGGGR
jgi:hypothetical protein